MTCDRLGPITDKFYGLGRIFIKFIWITQYHFHLKKNKNIPI